MKNYIIGQGGSRLPYYMTGQGFPIVIFNGLTCTQDNLKYLKVCLSKTYEVISWDYKGHGLADSPGDFTYITVNSFVWDAYKLFQELNIRKAILLGYGLGAELMFEFALRHKEIPVALISVNGLAGNVMSHFFNTDLFAYPVSVLRGLSFAFSDQYNTAWDLIMKAPEWLKLKILKLAFLDSKKNLDEDMKPFLENLSKMDPNLFLHLLNEFHHHSVLNDLPSIKVPTLLIASEKDKVIPPHCSAEIHSMIKNSELVTAKGSTHNCTLENYEFLCHEIRSFLYTHKVAEFSEVRFDI